VPLVLPNAGRIQVKSGLCSGISVTVIRGVAKNQRSDGLRVLAGPADVAWQTRLT
jgi:hypothetical protein